jgi:hypothetical protein
MFRCLHGFKAINSASITKYLAHDEIPLLATATLDHTIHFTEFDEHFQCRLQHHVSEPHINSKSHSIQAISFHRYLPQLTIGVTSSCFGLLAPSFKFIL